MRARVSEARGRWFDSSRSLQIFDIRGLGKRINPLGLGPRESRFKSEVPDQVLWGSQVVRRPAVNVAALLRAEARNAAVAIVPPRASLENSRRSGSDVVFILPNQLERDPHHRAAYAKEPAVRAAA